MVSRIDSLTRRLESGGLEGVVRDVQRFARRRPGTFLAGAGAIGFITGRLVRAGRDQPSSTPPSSTPPSSNQASLTRPSPSPLSPPSAFRPSVDQPAPPPPARIPHPGEPPLPPSYLEP